MSEGPEPEPEGANFDTETATVRRVGDRRLFIGDWGAASPENHGLSFDRVVSLTVDERPLTDHHHPLRDGPGNDEGDVVAAIETAREALRDGGDVLIHCAAGVSRSATVLTAAVAAEEDREFGAVLEELREYRERARPHPALTARAKAYLGESLEEREQRYLDPDQADRLRE